MNTKKRSASCKKYKKLRKGGVGSATRKSATLFSPLRRGFSATRGHIDEFVVEDIDEISSLEKCKKQYRLLKFGYDVYEKRNAELLHQLEKLKRK